MPIKPENRAKYPPRREWAVIRDELKARAGDRREGSPKFPGCRAANGLPHPETGSKVVLTVAHLDHEPGNNGVPGDRPNIRVLCQRCHLAHDHAHHQLNAAATRDAKRGQMRLWV